MLLISLTEEKTITVLQLGVEVGMSGNNQHHKICWFGWWNPPNMGKTILQEFLSLGVH